MKKFILGVLCGVLVTVPVSTFAAVQLVAHLYPSKVTIHQEGSSTNFNSADSPFINYNNRIYVPLRAFSEAMGSYVNFTPASNENGNLNQIDIYSLQDVTPIQDVEGYVSLYITGIEPSKYFNDCSEVSGIIKVNKDLFGKRLEFGSSINITGELFSPIQKGQTRSFSALLGASNLTDVPMIARDYPVVVKNLWGTSEKINHTVLGLSPSEDMALRFLRGESPDEELSKKYRQNDMLLLFNNTEKDIIMRPLTFTYQIVKVEDGKDKMIAEVSLPVLEGLLPADSCIGCTFPTWDYKDKDGKYVSPGRYAIKIIAPENFEFTQTDASEINFFPVAKDFRSDRSEFNIVQ